MKVVPIPANQDNYMYLLVDNAAASNPQAAIVDPVAVSSIFDAVKSEKAMLHSALVTHHHWDHAGGTAELMAHKSDSRSQHLCIYGGDANRIEQIGKVLQDGQQIELGALKITAMSTPCHTRTHICYFVEDPSTNQRAVFTGDTLFIGGCGRFFEGTAEQMNYALNERLGKLPDDTLVYCGHEYTVQNLHFAETIEPDNAAIRQKLEWAEKQRKGGQFTVPSTIGEERQYNVFMRVGVAAVQKRCGTQGDPIATMQALHEMKNNFKVIERPSSGACDGASASSTIAGNGGNDGELHAARTASDTSTASSTATATDADTLTMLQQNREEVLAAGRQRRQIFRRVPLPHEPPPPPNDEFDWPRPPGEDDENGCNLM